MLNSTIKEMTVVRINEWLPLINEMIKHYKGKGKVDVCPFCHVVSGMGCDYCLWRIIEGMDCEEFAHKLYGHWRAASRRRDLRNKKWRNARLTQLPRWRRILKTELKRRAEKAL